MGLHVSKTRFTLLCKHFKNQFKIILMMKHCNKSNANFACAYWKYIQIYRHNSK